MLELLKKITPQDKSECQSGGRGEISLWHVCSVQLLLLSLRHSTRLCALMKYALQKMPLETVIESPTLLIPVNSWTSISVNTETSKESTSTIFISTLFQPQLFTSEVKENHMELN